MPGGTNLAHNLGSRTGQHDDMHQEICFAAGTNVHDHMYHTLRTERMRAACSENATREDSVHMLASIYLQGTRNLGSPKANPATHCGVLSTEHEIPVQGARMYKMLCRSGAARSCSEVLQQETGC
jgi:hypothetical protein